MYSEVYVEKDKRGFCFNVDFPWIRDGVDSEYYDYVQTYTDDKFKADVFLRYGKHYGPKTYLDEMMDNESKRRFGCLVLDVYNDIVSYIKTKENAMRILTVNVYPMFDYDIIK